MFVAFRFRFEILDENFSIEDVNTPYLLLLGEDIPYLLLLGENIPYLLLLSIYLLPK